MGESGAQEVCRHHAWETEFFGRRMARVSLPSAGVEEMARVLEWCGKERVDCVTFLADCGDDASIRAALGSGFDLVDLRVTLATSPGDRPEEAADEEAGVRPFRDGDLPALVSIARSGHRDSRFFHDPRIPSSRAEDLFQVWIEKSCAGWADTVLVAEAGGKPSGYLTCSADGETASGSIGLFAVAEEARGKGLGSRLVRASLGWFGTQRAERVEVATQGRNTAAQSLYQKHGFRTRSIGLWFHRWF